MYRTCVALAVLAAFAFLNVTGCSSREPEGQEGGVKGSTTAPSKQFVIGMSQCNLGEPWRVQMNEDVKTAASKHAELKMLFSDAQNDSTKQQNQVRQFIQQKVDLIIISPKEAKPLTAPVREAIKGGIPVIVLDRKVEGTDYTCFIGADNVKIGREAGKYVAQMIGGKGNVIELKGLMTSTPGQERNKGFRDGIRGSKIQVVAEADCKWLEPNAMNEMRSILARFPKIDAVYAHNDPQGHGAYLAAKQEGKGREKSIKFIGIDALPHEGVQYVKQGILSATFQYPTGGEVAIDTALRIFRRETVPKEITLGTQVFTKENPDGKAL